MKGMKGRKLQIKGKVSHWEWGWAERDSSIYGCLDGPRIIQLCICEVEFAEPSTQPAQFGLLLLSQGWMNGHVTFSLCLSTMSMRNNAISRDRWPVRKDGYKYGVWHTDTLCWKKALAGWKEEEARDEEAVDLV
jgi:hypothetical protein